MSEGMFKDLTFKKIREITYFLSSSPKGLLKKDDPNAIKLSERMKEKNLIDVPKSFCLNISPCPSSEPEVCCGSGSGNMNDPFNPLNNFASNTSTMSNISSAISSCFSCLFSLLLLYILIMK